MSSRAALERRLADLDGFDAPRVDLEQYPTPPGLAAHLLHLADLRGDLDGRTVVDLGAGTGLLALGASLRGADPVVGIERDGAAMAVARRNARRLGTPEAVGWVRGDATRVPLCPSEPVTVVMNPPFGAQRGHRHADRAFLSTVAGLASVSYSIHNAESRGFVEAFAADNDGRVTDAYRSTVDLERRFPFHEEAVRDLEVEAFRIEWTPR